MTQRKAKEQNAVTSRSQTRTPRSGNTNLQQAQLDELIQRTRSAPESLTSAEVLQLQRAIGNRASQQLLAQRSPDRSAHYPSITPVSPLQKGIQRDDYPYGSADTIPHIHRYGADFHVKFLDPDRNAIIRVNLVVNGIRVLQSKLYETFEKVKRQYGNTHGVVTTMAALLKNVQVNKKSVKYQKK